MDFRYIRDRLVKKYPWLNGYVNAAGASLRFSVKMNSFNNSSLCPLLVYIRNARLCIESCLDINAGIFPLVRDEGGELVKPDIRRDVLDWDWSNSRECWDDVYVEVAKYLSALKNAITWYNLIPFENINNTLAALGFERKNILRHWLEAGDVIVDVSLPTALAPYFRLTVRRKGTPSQKWFNVFAATFDDMLDKFVNVKGE